MIRTILFAAILMSGVAVKAQVVSPFGAVNATESDFRHPLQVSDTNKIHKKWFVTKYAGISSGFLVSGGRGNSFLSVPLALQVNRQLTNNLYAFGGVSVAPYIFPDTRAPYQTMISKNKSFLQSNNFTTYSDAKIGMMYINTERTFSISGSIGVSRGNFNSYSPLYTPVFSPVRGNTRF
ncbi:hypothetical protein AAHN97_11905 [Chitinophaga niabensis]|uniref:hypothetical protein n=1 Tax=Chitinophaga niabensis TaxID=536979 RepID=UPI0031BAA4D4